MDLLRTSDSTPLLLSTNHGVEDITAQEFREQSQEARLEGATVETCPDGMTGYVRVASEADLPTLLNVARRMRSIQHILAPVYAFDLAAEGEAMTQIRDMLASHDVPEMNEAASFRVTSNRRGNHSFTSMDVMKAAGDGLVDRYKTDVDLEEYDVEVRVDVRHRRVRVGVQHTRDPLSRRHARLYQPQAALSPHVAYAMLRLPHLSSEPRAVVDPFCGSGTLLIEAAMQWPGVPILGVDRSKQAVDGARLNVRADGFTERINIVQGDARSLRDVLPDVDLDLIVTNPPFGKRIGESLSLHPFYAAILEEFHHALAPGGWLVILVLDPGTFSGAMQSVKQDTGIAFDVRHVRRIHTGGLHPRVFVMQR
jgi:putative N6-adenine-specific DNA methylase/tRNA (guanine6-N2)-methyltransferase